MKDWKAKTAMQLLTAAAALAMIMALCSWKAFFSGCQALQKDVLRLHILAQSDSADDQRLKLLVRDRILEGTAGWLSGSKEEMMAKIEARLPEIEAMAEEALAEEGCSLPVRAELAQSFFDTRTYGEKTMPAGRYDALRVVIGEGEGKNWWCVLYPPLCLPAAEADALLDETFSAEEQAVLEGGNQFKIRFWTVEMIEQAKYWLCSVTATGDKLEGGISPSAEGDQGLCPLESRDFLKKIE